MVVKELTIPVEQEVQELTARTVIGAGLSHVTSRLNHLEVQSSCLCVTRAGAVEGWQAVVLNAIIIIGVETEATCKAQTFGDEVELLFQSDIRLNIVLPFGVVTGLCGTYPRVDVIFVQLINGLSVFFTRSINALSRIIDQSRTVLSHIAGWRV